MSSNGSDPSDFELPRPEPDPIQERLLVQHLLAGLFGGQASMGIGRYQIERELGRGGMGVVYLARDTRLERQVAIKTLLTSEDAQQQLLAEAQAMARVDHPNVVQVYDVDSSDGFTFIVMAYIEGETLKRWLESKQRLWRRTLSMFRGAGEGLAAAHDRGLVHRDFKPANVMVGSRDQTPRVMDFGLARVNPGMDETLRYHGGIGEKDLRVTTDAAGTPRYMAPEQLQGAVSPASDQYAFCVSLYEALYGEAPFCGSEPAAIWEAAKIGRFRDPPEGTEVPDSVRSALLRGLAPAARSRHPSLRALLIELDSRTSRSGGAVQTRVHWRILVSGDFEDVDAERIRLQEILRLASRDPGLEIVAISPGSIDAIFLVSLRGGRLLAGMYKDGYLSARLGAKAKLLRRATREEVTANTSSEKKSDESLLKAWAEGDRSAGHELIDRYHTSIARFFLGKVGPEAKDLIQDTFMGLLEAADRFRGGSSVRTFLFAIARNKLNYHFRKQAKSRGHSFEPNIFEIPDAGTTEHLRYYSQMDLRVIIGQALEKLPQSAAEVIVMHYAMDFTFRDIAEILGVSVLDVDRTIQDARELLASIMEG